MKHPLVIGVRLMEPAGDAEIAREDQRNRLGRRLRLSALGMKARAEVWVCLSVR